MMWQPWQYSSKEDLAYYVIPDITHQLKLTLPGLSSTQANTLEGRKKLLGGIYNWLCHQGIEYEYEPPSNNDHQQIIRTPQAILQDNKKGTCLDLALLFAGLCLEFRLLPLVVNQKGHSFVLVSLQQNRDELHNFMGEDGLEGGLVTDAIPLSNPRDYVAIECTGFARSLGGFTEELPEFVSRWDGLLSFGDAMTVGKHRLAQGMEYAVNVAYWQDEEGYQPYAMESESSASGGNKYNINVEGGQVGVIGDGTTVHGGIHFGTKPASTNIKVGDVGGDFSGNLAGGDIHQTNIYQEQKKELMGLVDIGVTGSEPLYLVQKYNSLPDLVSVKQGYPCFQLIIRNVGSVSLNKVKILLEFESFQDESFRTAVSSDIEYLAAPVVSIPDDNPFKWQNNRDFLFDRGDWVIHSHENAIFPFFLQTIVQGQPPVPFDYHFQCSVWANELPQLPNQKRFVVRIERS